MQSICHSTRKSNIRMLKRIFGKRIWDSCAYLTGGVQIRLLDQLDAPVTGFLADGAYDGASTRALLRERYGETLDVVIPPPKNAVIRPQSARDPTDRDRHIAQIRSNGRMAWQLATGYNQRSRIETQIGRWKSVIGPKLKSRSFRSDPDIAAPARHTVSLPCLARLRSRHCSCRRTLFRLSAVVNVPSLTLRWPVLGVSDPGFHPELVQPPGFLAALSNALLTAAASRHPRSIIWATKSTTSSTSNTGEPPGPYPILSLPPRFLVSL